VPVSPLQQKLAKLHLHTLDHHCSRMELHLPIFRSLTCWRARSAAISAARL
jgi:hypothetical protein